VICLRCLQLYPESAGDACPTCGAALLPPTTALHERVVSAQVARLTHALLESWQRDRLLDAATAARLLPTLPRLPESPRPIATAPVVPAPDTAPPVVPAPDLVPAPATPEEQRPSMAFAEAPALEPEARDARLAAEDHELAGGALGALLALDARESAGDESDESDESDAGGAREPSRWRGEVLPLLYENIGWFLGALFVLAGSIYGVREAWQSLGSVPRHLLVAGALFAYGAGFIGIGSVVARRSASAGRVLSGIGVLLVPVAYVGLSSLIEASRAAGLVASLALTALLLPLLGVVARRFELPGPAPLVGALVPSLLAELAVASLPGGSWARALLPLAGIAAVALVPPATATLPLLGAALHGAASLCIFALSADGSGGPGGSGVADAAAGPGAAGYAAFGLWAAALALVVEGRMGRGALVERAPRASAVGHVLALAVAGCAALAAGLSVASPEPDRALSLVAAATAAASTATYLQAMRRHPGALHPAILSGAIAAALLARFVAPLDPIWRLSGVGAAAAGLLVLYRRGGPAARGAVVGWAVVLGVGALLGQVAMAGAAQSLAAPLLSAAVLCAAAHAAAGLARPRLHYLGALVGGVAVLAQAWLAGPVPPGNIALRLLACALVWCAAGLAHRAVLARREEGSPAWAESRPAGWTPDVRPFDDASLAALCVAFLFAAAEAPAARSFLLTPEAGPELPGLLPRHYPLLAVAALLLARSFVDRSRLVGLAGAATIAYSAMLVAGAGNVAQLAMAFGAVALAGALVGALRGAARPEAPGVPPPAHHAAPRRLFGAVPMPLAARGTALWADGFSWVSLVSAGLTALALAPFLAAPTEALRPTALGAALLLTATLASWFLTRTQDALGLRGATGTLFLLGGGVGLTAAVNRVGRPLSPEVTGLRLTIVLAVVWLLARLLARWGAPLARLLRDGEPRARYHLVPHAGVAVLGALLLVDAMVVGGATTPALQTVPPMMLVGASLAVGLLGRSSRSVFLMEASIALLLPAAALIGAQGAVLGPTFARGGAGWVLSVASEAALSTPPMQAAVAQAAAEARALRGLGAAGLLMAAGSLLLARARLGPAAARLLLSATSTPDAADPRQNAPARALARWAAVAGASLLLSAWLRSDATSAAAAVATGVVLAAGNNRRTGLPLAALGAAELVHSIALLSPTGPTWAGPALSLLALIVAGAAPRLAGHGRAGAPSARNADGPRRPARPTAGGLLLAHATAALVLSLGLGHALAAGLPRPSPAALPELLGAASLGLSGRWAGSIALPLTLLAWAATLGLGARDAGNTPWPSGAAYARLLGSLAALLVGASAATAVVDLTVVSEIGPQAWQALLASSRSASAAVVLLAGPALALSQAAAAAASHATARGLLASSGNQGNEPAPPSAMGLRAGRDALLIASGLFASWYGALAAATVDASPGAGAFAMGAAALALAGAISAHAGWREGTARHVYFVQLAVVGVYGLLRSDVARAWPAEVDAVFGLSLGFLLLGVTVLARRAGIPPVARATRLFAALLPLGIAATLPGDRPLSMALVAAGSAALYGALAWVEQSRALGTLGAIAANAALLLFALASGLSGAEIYLAPFGLLVLALGHLFAPTLTRATRQAVRTVGTLLLYAPAASAITFQLGRAQHGGYALVFGTVCLAGIGAGMLLHIRAYLALGTGFLVLDIVANLVHAGLRDHRVGFAVLSATGLLILATMVLTTLRREAFERQVGRWRLRLRAWE
jgi:hypothetical protein